ncbi:hypothetical protein EVAR_75785_1 [Eumeta japonica]|uniref:Uncharacterized protein n=1 Tax=Eumeta variegata TaxID=151549 RepID=A0A4C1TGB8_EUMVA|nr:hypothetical protein EVAR_75785_1 [Eumeta japonica]
MRGGDHLLLWGCECRCAEVTTYSSGVESVDAGGDHLLLWGCQCRCAAVTTYFSGVGSVDAGRCSLLISEHVHLLFFDLVTISVTTVISSVPPMLEPTYRTGLSFPIRKKKIINAYIKQWADSIACHKNDISTIEWLPWDNALQNREADGHATCRSLRTPGERAPASAVQHTCAVRYIILRQSPDDARLINILHVMRFSVPGRHANAVLVLMAAINTDEPSRAQHVISRALHNGSVPVALGRRIKVANNYARRRPAFQRD